MSGPLSASKQKLRLWIRLLRASRIIEGELPGSFVWRCGIRSIR